MPVNFSVKTLTDIPICRLEKNCTTRLPVRLLTSLYAAQSSMMKSIFAPSAGIKADEPQPAFVPDFVVLRCDHIYVSVTVNEPIIGSFMDKCGADKHYVVKCFAKGAA